MRHVSRDPWCYKYHTCANHNTEQESLWNETCKQSPWCCKYHTYANHNTQQEGLWNEKCKQRVLGVVNITHNYANHSVKQEVL